MAGGGCFSNTNFMDDPHNLDSHASDCVKKKHLTCTPKDKKKKKKLSYPLGFGTVYGA